MSKTGTLENKIPDLMQNPAFNELLNQCKEADPFIHEQMNRINVLAQHHDQKAVEEEYKKLKDHLITNIGNIVNNIKENNSELDTKEVIDFIKKNNPNINITQEGDNLRVEYNIDDILKQYIPNYQPGSYPYMKPIPYFIGNQQNVRQPEKVGIIHVPYGVQQKEEAKVENNQEEEQEESNWEVILAGIIIIMSILALIFAFANFKKQKDEIEEKNKQAKEEKVENKEKPTEEHNTTQKRDEQKATVEEDIQLSQTKHDAINDKLVGNQSKPESTTEIQLTNDAKQALDIVNNPSTKKYIQIDATGKKVEAYGVCSKNGQIAWRDGNGRQYSMSNKDVTIFDKSGNAYNNNVESILDSFNVSTSVADKVGTSTITTHSYTDVLQGNNQNVVLNYKTADGALIGTGNLSKEQLLGNAAISTTQYNSFSKAVSQNPTNSFFSNFKCADGKVTMNSLTTDVFNNNDIVLGTYSKSDGFSSNIGTNDNIKKVADTENTKLNPETKLVYQDGGEVKTMDKNIISYNVENDKITVKLDTKTDGVNYDTRTYDLNDKSFFIQDKNNSTIVNNDQLKLANNIQRYNDPHTNQEYILAKNTTTQITANPISNSYSATIKVGDEIFNQNLTADQLRSNPATIGIYNNNDKLYQMVRFNEGYDNSKYTSMSYQQAPVYNNNTLSNLETLQPIKYRY